MEPWKNDVAEEGGPVTKTELLDRVSRSGEERQLLSRALDKVREASRGAPAHTSFLSPAQQEGVKRLLNAAGHPRHLFTGGYPDAERRVCAFLPDWQEEDGFEPPFVALRCRWQSGETLTHRDFLGSILGQGIDREKVGDLLVGEDFCDIIVMEELKRYLLQSFDSAGRTKLRVEEIPLDELRPPEKKIKAIRDTVSSLRLDAVMATGFSLSRGKAAEAVSAGRVEVNHTLCQKADRAVAEGDTLTCRGLGKCVLTRVSGLSKKGRIMIEMERYL